MNLIVETDLGNDPDDFFALCYLIGAGAVVVGVNLVPGFDYQVSLADLIRRTLDVDFLIGVADPDAGSRVECSANGFHSGLFRTYGRNRVVPDGEGFHVMRRLDDVFRDIDVLVIGPPKSTGKFLAERPTAPIGRLLMQGGFCGYHIHRPRVTLPQFEDREFFPSFNPNGCPRGVESIKASAVKERLWVSKNVCHTINFDRGVSPMPWSDDRGKQAAIEMYRKAGSIYFSKHASKKWHDPTAAVCLLHPEIATWVNARMERGAGGWGAVADPDGDRVIVDIDRDGLWRHLTEFT